MSHLAGELLQRAAGVKLTHVPYKGAAQALTDTLGGQADSFMSSVPSALAQVKGGRLRALAVSSAARSSELPGTPTIAESGFPDSRRPPGTGCSRPPARLRASSLGSTAR